MGNDSKWKQGQEGAERETSGNLNRVKFPAPAAGRTSTTVIRLLEDDFEEAYVVFVDDPQGNRRRISISVDDWKNGNQEHPLIALYKKNGDENLRAGRKYFLNCYEGTVKRFQKIKNKKPVMDEKTGKAVIIRKTVLDPQVKLLEIGPKIFQQISSYRNDEEYPDIDDVVIKIERTGSSKNDTSYVVKANGDPDLLPAYPKEPTEPNNLTEISAPTSYEEVRKILGVAPVETKETDVETESAPEAGPEVALEAEAGQDETAKETPTEEVETEVEAPLDELQELDEI